MCIYMPILFKNILKVLLITLIFLWGYRVFLYASSWEIVAEKIIETNQTRYESANDNQLLYVSAAISTRIGIAYSENWINNIASDFYKQISSIWETPEDKREIRKRLISQNMLIIWEYLNLSRADIKSLLDSTSDRKKTLESFIMQLELREKNSRISLESLQRHKVQLLAYIQSIEWAIENTKWNMEREFSAGNSQKTLEATDEYFSLREQYTIAFTDIVFINQFIKQHSFLIEYNSWILNTLKSNKQAIINENYIVIPSSGDDYLRPLELIFDESELEQN